MFALLDIIVQKVALLMVKSAVQSKVTIKNELMISTPSPTRKCFEIDKSNLRIALLKKKEDATCLN